VLSVTTADLATTSQLTGIRHVAAKHQVDQQPITPKSEKAAMLKQSGPCFDSLLRLA
jgi:hypothetical protein